MSFSTDSRVHVAGVSIDATFSRLQRSVEDLDELMSGAAAQCRHGNYGEAGQRLAIAVALGEQVRSAVAVLHRRVVAAATVPSGWV